MKLLVCCNHAAPFHVGGSEKVIQQITESMTADFGMECLILTRVAMSKIHNNGVAIDRLASTSEGFLQQIETFRPDHILTYSDFFHYWKVLVDQAENIRASQSVALVGMNRMLSDQTCRDLFVQKREFFRTITHSDNYVDYEFCKNNGVDVTVIPNAIDFREFAPSGSSGFKKKYGIKTPKMILCVSNFFPGKGQEHLYHVLKTMEPEGGRDWTAVFVACPVSFGVANIMMDRFKTMLGRAEFKSRMLIDIPREDTIQAFKEADVFAFPSQQEVAPLVIMEAMAAGIPWVSLNVGNVPTLKGGIVVSGDRKQRGQLQYDNRMYKAFGEALTKLLADDTSRKILGSEGLSYITEKHDWEKIKTQYYNLFSS